MYIHETRGRPILEPYVLFPHTREIWIGTTHVALVYTHLEATLCCTIDHMRSLAIAHAVLFIKTFKLCFYYLLI